MAILKPENIEFLVTHCSATPPNMDIGIKEIDIMHKKRGWSKAGYHVVIRRESGPYGGLIEFGPRAFQEVGAHVKGYNSVSIGICMVGGVDINNKPENNFTENQFHALLKTLIFLTAIFPKAKVVGHRDFPGVNKACPCFNAQDWWLSKHDLGVQISQPKPILADVFEW